jgi:hypothetical protein
MNSLNINLEEGDKVVLEGDCHESIRTVTVTGGFGMSKNTAGTGLFVELPNGTTGKANSMEIERRLPLLPECEKK